jgi:hypothetical protein
MDSSVASLGVRSVVAITVGGLAVLLGLVGFTRLLMSALLTDLERRSARYRLWLIGSPLLIVTGGAVLLGVAVVPPLKALKNEMSRATYVQTRSTQIQEENLNLMRALNVSSAAVLARITQTQEENLKLMRELKASSASSAAFLLRIARQQAELYTQTILEDPQHRDPKRLGRSNFKMTSQNGEDGIIAEIFHRIGTTNRYFVEFGASYGVENNTACLLRLGWGGLWMDASAPAVEAVKKKTFPREIESGQLTMLETFITAENIEDLFRQGKVPEEFDLLSIDIDRNDYYVWEKITHYRPRVVIVEYNAVIPPTTSWVVPYDAKAFGFNSFGNGNGASLKALEELGAKKGYSLVGCDLCGVNAFFVRNDLLGDHFAAPYTAENHYEPFRYMFLSR